MDSQYLHLTIDYVGGYGVVLSSEQKAALQTSLLVLRNQQKFARVQFWGKILGVQDDYYIAQGFSGDQFVQRKTLYSKDCVRWLLLNAPTEEMRTKARLMRGRFTGNPSELVQYRQRLEGVEGGEDTIREEVIELKEEDRLAAVIADIDHEAVIVPRSAFIKSPTGEVLPNRHFEGLSPLDAVKLGSYQHFRRAERPLSQSVLERANFERAIDFMDSIEDDIPKGCWSVQLERGSGLVSIKSLLWLGYFFYHVPASRQYGSVYVGTGEKNIDLPFML